jgi:hypothetical protein
MPQNVHLPGQEVDALQCGPVVDLGVGAIAQLTEPAPQVAGAFRGRVCSQALGFLAGLAVNRLELLPAAGAGLGVRDRVRYFFFRPVVESLDGFLKKRASFEAR